MKKDYSTYKTDDFILDDNFREIVSERDTKSGFKKLLKDYPEKKREINLAARIVRELKPGSFHQPEKRKRELWLQITGEQKTKIRLTWIRVAATVMLLLGIGSIAYYWLGQKDAGEILVETKITSDDAFLILDNGESVAISSKESSVTFSADGSEIVVNDSSQIARSSPIGGINQLIVPYGKRSFITLSEGTKVWLNSGSKLAFSSVFSGNLREVEVQGEAYFEVTANSEKPFFVKTDFFKIKVYGTKFNVQAYRQKNISNLVLVEGKVGMSSGNKPYTDEIFLSPNQKASITNGGENFEIDTVEDVGIYTAWKDGYLAFVNEEVNNVLIRVSRYYNVIIEANFSDNVEHIYGKLELKDEVEKVLDGVAFISKTSYKKEGETYIFYD